MSHSCNPVAEKKTLSLSDLFGEDLTEEAVATFEMAADSAANDLNAAIFSGPEASDQEWERVRPFTPVGYVIPSHRLLHIPMRSSPPDYGHAISIVKPELVRWDFEHWKVQHCFVPLASEPEKPVRKSAHAQRKIHSLKSK